MAKQQMEALGMIETKGFIASAEKSRFACSRVRPIAHRNARGPWGEEAIFAACFQK